MAKKSQNWEAMMEEWFLKLPPLPKNAREALVKITPWIALIFGILGILAGLAGFGLLAAFSPFIAMGSGLNGAAGSLVSAFLALVASVFLLLGFPGTKNKKMQGWKMLFWSEVISVIGAVIAISLSGVVFSAIGFYLLYQIKSYYK